MDHFKKDMLYFGIFMAVLFVLWVITGGPQKAVQDGSANDKFQKALQPIDSGQTYDASISAVLPVKVNFQNTNNSY